MQQVIENLRLEGRLNDEYSEEEILLLEDREKRKYDLYQLLYKGKLDLDELNRNYSNHFMLSEYRMLNDFPFSRRNKFYENYPFSEEVVKNVMNMSCYCSFNEYYTRVLKRK